MFVNASNSAMNLQGGAKPFDSKIIFQTFNFCHTYSL